MRKFVIAAALAAVALSPIRAIAADLSPFAAPVANSYNWQGAYVGANVGAQWGWVGNSSTRPFGAAGGLQAGYNWQRGQFVFGAETDIQGSSANDQFAAWKFSNPWFGTLRGRAGYAMNNVMMYGTLGLAYGTLQAQSTLTGVSESKTEVGWAAGAGIEVAMFGNWTVRAEYLYVDLGARTYSMTGMSHGIDSSLLRFGVNYRF